MPPTICRADTYAAAGFITYVPDILGGAPVAPEALSFMEDESKGVLASLRWGAKLLGVLPSMVSFLRAHGDAVTVPRVEEAVAAARAAASAQGLKLGGAGFCFGGKHVLLASARMDAVVCVHGSGVDAGVLAAAAAPVLLAVAEKDYMMNPKAAAAAAESIKARGVAVDSKVYAGMAHGFAVRGGPSTNAERAKCAADVTEWLSARLA